MDTKRMGNAHGERAYYRRLVEDDSNCHGEHEKLNEPNNLSREEKENRNDPDNTKEEWPEKILQIRHKAGAAQRQWNCRCKEVRRHRYSGVVERGFMADLGRVELLTTGTLLAALAR
jgi:hypothetical protein